MGTDPKRIVLAAVLLGLVAYAGYQAWSAQRIPVQYVSLTPDAYVASDSGSVIATPSRTPLFSRPTTTPSPRTTTVPADAQSIIDGLNRERAAVGSAVLVPQATLQSLAQAHVLDMVGQGYFDHTSPDGVTFEDRIRLSGYPAGVTGENLGLTTGDPSSVIASWMASPEHRANVVDRRFIAVGVALAQGQWQGTAAVFVVAVFGSVQ